MEILTAKSKWYKKWLFSGLHCDKGLFLKFPNAQINS